MYQHIKSGVILIIIVFGVGIPLLKASGNDASVIESQLSRVPLFFIENQGQLHEEVRFYLQGSDITCYFIDDGIFFDMHHGRACQPKRWVTGLKFIGADFSATPSGLEPLNTKFSYFKGEPEDWKTDIPVFGKLKYSNLWPGIDLIYSGSVNQLKYEFVVHPGADPAHIRMAYKGIEKVVVGEEGALQIDTPLGLMEDKRPYAFQDQVGSRKEIPVSYAIHDASGKGCCAFAFDVGSYDSAKTLIIDPALFVYCGFFGGGYSESCSAFARDKDGNLYVAGGTNSDQTQFSLQVGPDLTYNGEGDGYIAKLNPGCTELIYCGYIGGMASDSINALAVDEAGNAYVTGNTFSNEMTFPIRFGPDLTFNGYYSYYYSWGDVFAAKVNASGQYLDYCGYIGGGRDEISYSIAVDDEGSAYITGQTNSSDFSFPVIVGPDVTYNSGSSDMRLDAFVAKVNASGLFLDYCGYIGGYETDSGNAIVVDADHNAYICGETYADESTFPVKVGPDMTHNGGKDAFIARVNAAGSSLDFCGYIGGSGSDYGNAAALDSQGFVYVGGETSSDENSFPVIVGPDLSFNGISDAFLAKLEPGGTGMIYCGYVGGDNQEFISSIALDEASNAFVTGWTHSDETTFPVLAGPDLTYAGGWGDCFIAKVHRTGTGLEYCGYIGGDKTETAGGIAVDEFGHAYVTGTTKSDESSFPVVHAMDPTMDGYSDGFIAKVAMALATKSYTLPETGGIVEMALNVGPDRAGRNYLLLGGLSGTVPGHPLPNGMATLPLNWDAFTDLVLALLNTSVFSGFMETTDSNGQSYAELNAPALPPGFVGTKIYLAYCLNNPFDFVSNPLEIEVVP
ncbi:MAG: SBBP repeat-containing protein [Planctomycetota bacterium]